MSVEIKVQVPDQPPIPLSVDPTITVQNLKTVVSKRDELRDFIGSTPSFRLNLYKKGSTQGEGEKLDVRKKVNELDLGPNDVILVKIAGGIISVNPETPPTATETKPPEQKAPEPTTKSVSPVGARSLPPSPAPPSGRPSAVTPRSSHSPVNSTGTPLRQLPTPGNLVSHQEESETPAGIEEEKLPEKPAEKIDKHLERQEEQKEEPKREFSKPIGGVPTGIPTGAQISVVPSRKKDPAKPPAALPSSIAILPQQEPSRPVVTSNKSRKKLRDVNDLAESVRSKIIFADTMQGFVQVKGSSNGGHKWETFYCIINNGQLILCNKDTKELIEVIPMTFLTLDDIKDKKDKLVTKFAFALIDSKHKKWRNVFGVEAEKELNLWLSAINFAAELCSPVVFGSTLKSACLKANKFAPLVMESCINYIDKYLTTEGLFRIPGNKRETEEAQSVFDQGEIPVFQPDDAHLPCTLFKGYLRDLKEPLIPFNKYQECLNLVTISDTNHRLEGLKKVLNDVPHLNRIVLAYLLQFLQRVSAQSASNKMDTSNLALVFAPTIFRTEGSDVSIGDMGAGTEIMRLMLEKYNSLFSAEDAQMALNSCVPYTPEVEDLNNRQVLTGEEKQIIEAHIAPHHGLKISEDETVFDNTLVLLAHMKTTREKHNTVDPRVFVGDRNRVYIFIQEGGKAKLEHEFHLLDLRELLSPSPSSVTLTYQHKLRADSKPISITLSPISYASFDMDAIVHWINSIWERNFVGAPESVKFEFKVGPQKRMETLLEWGKVSEPQRACAGFLYTYNCVSDYIANEISAKITWDLENYYYPNGLKKFAVLDLVPKDKFPNTDFMTLVQALRYNLWFTSFKSRDVQLGNDSAAALARVFATNKTIQKFIMTNAGVTKNGITDLCKGFCENPNLALTELDISGNTIDSKSIQGLYDALCKPLGNLKYLNLANTQLPQKKGVSVVLEALGRTVLLVNSLTYLNLSDNKFDAESSQMLGAFLTLTRALQTLSIAGTSPVFGKIVEAMTSNNSLQPCVHLKKLDVSRNPIEKKKKGDNDEFTRFLMNLPELLELNIAGTNLPAESVVDILAFNRRLTYLDLSDNDLTDDGISLMMKQITSMGPSSITTLKMNRVFKKSTTSSRQPSMAQIAKVLNSTSIEEFEMQGDKKAGRGLKADELLEVVLNLVDNKSLTRLDISGNQAGDDLGMALGKVLQHNDTLSTLLWDGNDMGLVGFKAVKLGLERNSAMQYLETPFEDIFTLKSRQDVNPEQLSALIKEICKIVSENQKLRETESRVKKGKAAKPVKEKKKHAPINGEFRRASYAFLFPVKKPTPSGGEHANSDTTEAAPQ